MKLTKAQKHAMSLIKDGADVSSMAIAHELREIKRKYPNLIRIVKPQGDYDGAGHVTYFGAILTQKGRQVIGI